MGSTWIFPRANTPKLSLNRAMILAQFQKATLKALGKKAKFHHLRHMFNTRAKAFITNENTVKAATSHESDRASAVYTHLNSEIGSELSKNYMREFAT